MSDFQFHVDILRGPIARELACNVEQAVWVLAAFSELADLTEMAEHVGNIDVDASEVAAFYCQFADMIEGGQD